MTKHYANIAAALQRVKGRQPPDERDQAILVPLLEDILRTYDGGAIPFRQVGRPFVVDTTEFRNLLGFSYLQELLKNPGQWVPAKTLSPINKTVIFTSVVKPSFVRTGLNKKNALLKKLKWMRGSRSEAELTETEKEKERQIAEELLEIESVLSKTTFGGRIKHMHNDYDRNRQTVCKCIRLAISYLEDNPSTAHIGYHLREHVKTGARCRYTGKWKWIT